MLVVAGAGTGKTTVLIQRIVRLVRENHARPDEILAVTYTDNAAKEMQERIQAEAGRNLAGLRARGGSWLEGTFAGVFKIDAGFNPSQGFDFIGLRCAR